MAEEQVNVEQGSVEQPSVRPEEQEALDRYRESQKPLSERESEVPEGYNEDGTEKVELIGGKFKSQEDLLKAYQELEKKQSKPEADTKVTSEEKSTDQGSDQPTDQATSAIDINKYGQEFATNGSLSEKSYKELESYGFSKTDVDNYIQGRQLAATAFTNSVYDKAGGQEAYTDLVTWAAENIPANIIDEYNTALQSQNTDKVIQLVEYMNFKKKESSPRRLEGEAGGYGGMQPFADKNEWQKAQTNRLYGKDAKYTNMVDKRYLESRKRGIL